jgi:hypothetical protein
VDESAGGSLAEVVISSALVTFPGCVGRVAATTADATFASIPANKARNGSSADREPSLPVLGTPVVGLDGAMVDAISMAAE